jgi:hypothetical protein
MYLTYVQETIERAMNSDDFVGPMEDFLKNIAIHPERKLMHEYALSTMADIVETAKRVGVEFTGDPRINESPAARFVRLTDVNSDKNFASEFDTLMRAMDGLRQLGCSIKYDHAGAPIPTQVEDLSMPATREERAQQDAKAVALHCRVAVATVERDTETLEAVATILA